MLLPLVSIDDTTDLLEKAATQILKSESSLRTSSFDRYLGLATHLAGRYAGRGADREDLVQVASFALVKAIRGFNHDRGEFVPFATVTILGEIKKYFRDHCWGVRPPRRIQQLQADIAAATERRMQRTRTPRDDADLADELDADVSDIREARPLVAASRRRRSTSPTRSAVDRSARPCDRGDPVRLHRGVGDVAPLCQQLDDAERELLRLRFVEDKTQQEIAAIVGVSQMQVSRRLSKLLETLRSEALARLPD